jgi:isopenicillin-N epimerase
VDRARLSVLWPLDPAVAYLNHGSFGACPAAVLDFQAALRDELEREPVDFLVRRLPRRLAMARAALGGFVGAEADDLAFVTNATAGVNTVLRSLQLAPGEELLTTDHTYGACRKAMDHAASLSGARVVTAHVPFPLRDAEEVVEPVLAAASSGSYESWAAAASTA